MDSCTEVRFTALQVSRYDRTMVDDRALILLMGAIASSDRSLALSLLAATPPLAVATLKRGADRASAESFFFADCHSHVYAGDSALHVAAFAYETMLAQHLVIAGAEVRARNRRGAEPLHSAATGAPGSRNWNPQHQAAVIAYLIEAGAEPNASAAGGVTALHRAVRNRCSAAVRALLASGADPHQANDRGSTAFTLAAMTTGRSGSGSPQAKTERELIVTMLKTHTM